MNLLSLDSFNLNPNEKKEKIVENGHFPPWLHRKMPKGETLWNTGAVIEKNRLHTVCEEAKCPNILECWSKKTATFLLMGSICTRACGFCEIGFSKNPPPPDPQEPENIADSVAKLGLKHVVLTMVARDDITDGGALHLSNVIFAIRKSNTNCTIEVLTSDFAGNQHSWDTVLSSLPEIFNYNIETVRELTPRVRHKATYERTLNLLSYVKTNRKSPKMLVKSGLMLGLGETEKQVHQTLIDLKDAGCNIVTMGQYLQPSRKKLRVKAFIHPKTFDEYASFGRSIGISHIYAGPFVRSSYNAEQVFKEVSSN